MKDFCCSCQPFQGWSQLLCLSHASFQGSPYPITGVIKAQQFWPYAGQLPLTGYSSRRAFGGASWGCCWGLHHSPTLPSTPSCFLTFASTYQSHIPSHIPHMLNFISVSQRSQLMKIFLSSRGLSALFPTQHVPRQFYGLISKVNLPFLFPCIWE